MTDRRRYVVIPTRSRPDDFRDCVTAIAPQVDAVIVIAHGCPEYVGRTLTADAPGVREWEAIEYQAVVPNISRMWNLGLDAAARRAGWDPFDVAVINDDVICPPDWFARVTAAMDAMSPRAAAGCVRRRFDHRMTGYAFILDGRSELRADEQFRWWYGDDDLERRARQISGVAFAEGRDVEHRHPNSTTTGVLAEIAEQDADRYLAKWRGR